MGMDRFFARCDGGWKKLDEAEVKHFCTEIWVDLCF